MWTMDLLSLKRLLLFSIMETDQTNYVYSNEQGRVYQNLKFINLGASNFKEYLKRTILSPHDNIGHIVPYFYKNFWSGHRLDKLSLYFPSLCWSEYDIIILVKFICFKMKNNINTIWDAVP